MNQRVKSMFQEAQKLPAADREALAQLLLATIDVEPGVEQAWTDEIADRIAAHERGELRSRPAAEVLAGYLKTP